MAARVIHFGFDDCFRVAILEHAGYCVEQCSTIGTLHSNVIQFPKPDAVVIAECEGSENEAPAAISLVRASCTAPLVLFQGQGRYLETSTFDLIISPLTPPKAWLSDLGTLIEESRAIRARSVAIRIRSALLAQKAREQVERFRRERERSRSLLNRFVPDLDKK